MTDRIGWHWSGPCRCAICGHRWVAVIEIEREEDAPVVPLECPACGNMTGQPEDEGG